MNALHLNTPVSGWSWAEHMNRSCEEAQAELEREAHVRKRIYDRWIQEGKLSRTEAWDRMERLLTALRLLREYERYLKQIESEKQLEAEAEPLREATSLAEVHSRNGRTDEEWAKHVRELGLSANDQSNFF